MRNWYVTVQCTFNKVRATWKSQIAHIAGGAKKIRMGSFTSLLLMLFYRAARRVSRLYAGSRTFLFSFAARCSPFHNSIFISAQARFI
jgi:hypothetical protein